MSKISSTFRNDQSLKSTKKTFGGGFLSDAPTKSAMKKTTVANNLRKSVGSSFTTDLSMSGKLNKSTGELAHIEAEYIKNLQQQIYFLELEANYLREQARKATEIHPQMTKEAENMLSKLREMQKEMDKMDQELKRKDSSIGVHTSDRQRLEEVLQLEKESRQREKRLMTDELVTMKKEKDRMERELTRKDEQLVEARSEVNKSALTLKTAETKISTLRAQLEQRIDQHNLTQLALEEKRTDLINTETQLRETEEKYLSSTITVKDKLTEDLRNEIRLLHQRVKEAELSTEKDRFLRDKVSDELAKIVKENSVLNQQILELSKQLEREKELRDSTGQRHSKSISEMAILKDKLHENDLLRDQLRQEQERSRQYLEQSLTKSITQLTNEETSSKRTELQANNLRSQITEFEGMRSITEAEINQLRKDKILLVDHVAELQRKLEDRDKEIISLRSSIDGLDGQLRNVNLHKSLELTQQSQRWEEFSRLADSMKTLSQTMMSHTSYNAHSPRRYPTPSASQY